MLKYIMSFLIIIIIVVVAIVISVHSARNRNFHIAWPTHSPPTSSGLAARHCLHLRAPASVGVVRHPLIITVHFLTVAALGAPGAVHALRRAEAQLHNERELGTYGRVRW